MGDFSIFLGEAPDEAAVTAIRRSRSTGRPVGARDWIKALETQLSRDLAAAKRGPKPRAAPGDGQDDLFHTVSR